MRERATESNTNLKVICARSGSLAVLLWISGRDEIESGYRKEVTDGASFRNLGLQFIYRTRSKRGIRTISVARPGDI